MTEIDFWRAENAPLEVIEEIPYEEEMITKTTPCDYPDEFGHHRCPYEDTYTGYESEMCRVCCGLGVDE